jgi:hypothetical protein
MPGLIPHPLLAPIGDQRHPDSEWLNTWQRYITFDNPPNMRIIARTTQYLTYIFSRIEVCATEYQRRKEQSSKKQILCPHAGDEADNTDPSHQNPENHPTTVSLTVCANIYNASISDKIKSPRYKVMQDIIPSNCRLRTIHLQSTDVQVCQKCHHIDPVIHRLTMREVAGAIWRWTCSKVQLVTRINSRFPMGDWYDPSAKQIAVVWILAHIIYYIMLNHSCLSATDHINFMCRAWWKLPVGQKIKNKWKLLTGLVNCQCFKLYFYFFFFMFTPCISRISLFINQLW